MKFTTTPEATMDATTLVSLTQRAADLMTAFYDFQTSSITLSEMADGSGRSVALVYMYDATNDLEQTYRIISPAPWNSPAWAADFREWVEEVRIGDDWLALEAA